MASSAQRPVGLPVLKLSVLKLLAFCLLCSLGFALTTARADEASDAGAAQFKKSCGTCHTVDASAAPRQGPNLHKVVGRPAGTMKGFKYSPAFAKAASGITWTPDMIDKWITDPQQVIPGAVMLYHQSDADKRQQIIDFLKNH